MSVCLHRWAYELFVLSKCSNIITFQCYSIIAPPIKVPASWIEKKPCSDVYLTKHFPKTNFTLEEAIIMHRELADPTMMDNMHKFVYLDCKVDYEASTAKKVDCYSYSVLIFCGQHLINHHLSFVIWNSL